MADPQVAEHRRFCGRCDEPVGRSRDGAAGAHRGLLPALRRAVLVHRQAAPGRRSSPGSTRSLGCLAHGGLGWIYLARDRNVSDRWVVLKGLLNSGDEDAMAAALAERRFLAEVEHPNIVKIHNFVEHDGDGYIVMEYVDGVSLRGMLEARRGRQRRAARPAAGRPGDRLLPRDPAGARPPARPGLLFCDFKPDNVIQTPRLAQAHRPRRRVPHGRSDEPDLRHDRLPGAEIAETGPTSPPTCTPSAARSPCCAPTSAATRAPTGTRCRRSGRALYARLRLALPLPRAGDGADPDERFQSAEEMAAQLLGVLREVVAARRRHAGARAEHALHRRAGARLDARRDWRALPAPLVDPDDPAAGFIVSLGAAGPDEVIAPARHGVGAAASRSTSGWPGR